MAHIKKVLTKGEEVRWRLRVSLGRDPETGKRKVLTRTFSRKKDAEAMARRLEDMRDFGGLREPSRAPFHEYLRAWLKDVAKPRLGTRTFFGGLACLAGFRTMAPVDAA